MSLFEEIEGLVSAQLDVVKTAVSILKLETRLAGLSVYPLLLNLCLLLIGLMSAWTTSMVALGYILTMMIPNILICILLVLLLHVGIVFGLIRYLSFNLKNMSFEKTRQFIASKENHYVNQKTQPHLRNSQNGPRLTVPKKPSARSKK